MGGDTANRQAIMPFIITVAAAKGGVGKTTLAYELAAAFGGCLVDLDWDAGGATRMWGFDPRSLQRAPLLDAFERGPDAAAPRPRRRPHQPALVPSHPDLSASRIDADLVADCLGAWAPTLSTEAVVIDTHPGANALTDGAIAAADLVVVPAVLGMREMTALEQNLAELVDHRVLVVPTMVPAVPPRRLVDRLAAVAGGRVMVAPPISEHRWLRRRLRRAAVVSQPNPGIRVQAAALEFRRVAHAITEALDG
jgi:chromosome partitioning protein